ncbi:MAG TPA: DMT family transporter, partial [Patescibacteria group bacterium]|nr:DMT family transporter [Patescibacteria group bacterium]
VLLIIAFGTILQLENYNYKKWLPKLILMAILINFSKTICGLLIDVSQIIMLTFVNAFGKMGPGSLTNMLGLADWQSFTETETVEKWSVAAAYVLAVLYAFIALATVAAMVAMLVMRIVMIWVYVVLSPFAYLLSAFPGGASYASQWWKEFTKNLIVGPILAFFIWLSFAALGTPTSDGGAQNALGNFNNTGNDDIAVQDGAVKDYGTSDLMVQFIVSIAMLIGGMKIAQEVGGAAGSAAGKTFGKVKGLGLMGAGAVGGLVGGAVGTVSGYKFAKRRIGNWRQDLKKRSQQNTDLRYEKVKGGVKGTATGLATGLSRQFSRETEAERKSKKAKKDAKYQAKQEEGRHKNARYEAYREGVYTDSKGTKYDWDDSSKKYVNKDDGTVAKYKGKDVKKLSDFAGAYKEQMRDKTTKARALKNQMNDEKMSDKQKLFESAGTTTGDLKRIMQDGSASQDKRMAAVIELAIKDGFKNDDLKKGRGEVLDAKRVLGDNQPLVNKFDEKINKRFAALNFDVGTEKGNNEYKKAMADGRVDGYNQDASSYDKETAKVLRDYSGKDFGKKYGNMMSLSKDHRQKGMQSARDIKVETLQNGEKLYDNTTGEINPFVKLLAKNGDMEAAFNSSTTPGGLEFDNRSVNALDKYLQTASASDLDNFNTDFLDSGKLDTLLKKRNVSASPAEINNMVTRIEKTIVESVDVSKVSSLEHLDKNPEFVRRYIGLIDKHGSADKKKLITKNNVLRNIKPIK